MEKEGKMITDITNTFANYYIPSYIKRLNFEALPTFIPIDTQAIYIFFIFLRLKCLSKESKYFLYINIEGRYILYRIQSIFNTMEQILRLNIYLRVCLFFTWLLFVYGKKITELARSISASESLSCSYTGCSITSTFDFSVSEYDCTGIPTELYLSITDFGGDFGESEEYAEVYVGSTSIGVCSSDNDCGGTYTCLDHFDITNYAESTVSVELAASSFVNICTPYMTATIAVTGSCPSNIFHNEDGELDFIFLIEIIVVVCLICGCFYIIYVKCKKCKKCGQHSILATSQEEAIDIINNTNHPFVHNLPSPTVQENPILQEQHGGTNPDAKKLQILKLFRDCKKYAKDNDLDALDRLEDNINRILISF